MNYIFVHLLDNKVFYLSLIYGTNMKTTKTYYRCLWGGDAWAYSFERGRFVNAVNFISNK